MDACINETLIIGPSRSGLRVQYRCCKSLFVVVHSSETAVVPWSTCNAAAGASESSGVKVLTLAKKVTSLQVKVLRYCLKVNEIYLSISNASLLVLRYFTTLVRTVNEIFCESVSRLLNANASARQHQ